MQDRRFLQPNLHDTGKEYIDARSPPRTNQQGMEDTIENLL